jgi:glycosyltransferase involved in cell wall biosynthesis
MSAALVTTCYREAEAIDAFIDAVTDQTRQPDRIVIVDAGSDDGTAERVEGRVAAGAPITLIVEPGATRAAGRNRAIEAASADLIAVTDVGSRPRPDWFERIIAPLESNDAADVVAGYYAADPPSPWEAAVAAATVPAAEEVDPDTFLPSARSIAFRRSAWERAGGYPERVWVSEDTAFDLALKAAGARFVFEPAAVVEWRPEAAIGRLFAQFYRYARGDAECRIWFRHYTKAYVLAALALALIGGGIAWSPLWLGLAALGVAYWLRHALRARRRTPSLAAAALAPLANALVDAAHVVGYLRGLVERPHDAL